MKPYVGLGTSRLKNDAATGAVSSALLAGCVHIDCAKCYGNEKVIGNALKLTQLKVPRSKMHVTSKVWNDCHRPEDVRASCHQTLSDLGLDYLDLYLIHWPLAWKRGTIGAIDVFASLEATWRAMETLVDEGLVKSIGVSNFGKTLLRQLFGFCRIRPSCNQFECHVFNQQRSLVEFCISEGVLPVAWSPLARLDSSILENPTLRAVAGAHHGATVARVALRHAIQRGVAVIPRSKDPKHIADNLLAASSPVLSDQEMQEIDKLDTGSRITRDWVGIFDDTPYFPYRPLGWAAATILFAFWLLVPNIVDFRMPQSSKAELIIRPLPALEIGRGLVLIGIALHLSGIDLPPIPALQLLSDY